MLTSHLACFRDYSLFENCFAMFRSSRVSMPLTGDMRKSNIRQHHRSYVESGTNIKSSNMFAIRPDIRARYASIGV